LTSQREGGREGGGGGSVLLSKEEREQQQPALQIACMRESLQRRRVMVFVGV
jgi:hypothetical protein